MESLKNESELAETLKESCDESGRETNVAQSSTVLHQLGLTYRNRSPDKISLLQSIGLLNAAIARKPVNVDQIQLDLSETCLHILQLSGARQQSVDLIQKANDVKASINRLRKKVVDFLDDPKMDKIPENVKPEELHEKEANKISSMQSIGQLITNEYKQIMADLSEYCQNVMGQPPCKYCVAGMGSLARKEITPYSDFEHLLLMEECNHYESFLQYFRWMSVIFHVIVLNLQETIVPSLHIKSLHPWFFDAHTPRGVALDGMMPHACKFPLGRQEYTKNKPWTTELIKRVSEMLKYLCSEEDLKNGYHLKDILTRTCYVFGDEEIFQQFTRGVESFLHTKTKQERTDEVKQQVKEDLNNFSTRFRLTTLNSYNTINIKQMVYRSSTLFVAALGTVHGILHNSCFDIIEVMAKQNIITQNTKHKLSYAIAIACEMRLRTYMANQSQRDDAIDLNKNRESNINNFLDIVGVTSTISYFQITYCLQCEIAKQLKFRKLHFYSNPQLINLAISLAFGILRVDAELFLKNSSDVWDVANFDFDTGMREILSHFEAVANTPSLSSNVEREIEKIADRLNSHDMHDEAVELYKYVIHAWENKPKNKDTEAAGAEALYKIGLCLWKMRQNKDSLCYLKRSLKVAEELTPDKSSDRSIAMLLNAIGMVLRDLHDYEESLEYYQKAFDIFQKSSRDPQNDALICATLNNKGLSFCDLHRYESSLSCLRMSIAMHKKLSLDEARDLGLAVATSNLGICLHRVHNFDESLNCFQRALTIFRNTVSHEQKNQHVGLVHRLMGKCLTDSHQYDDALKHLNESVQIFQNKSLDEDKDRDVAETLYCKAICLRDMQKYSDALNVFKKSMKIYQTISAGTEDVEVADKLSSIDSYLHGLKQCK